MSVSISIASLGTSFAKEDTVHLLLKKTAVSTEKIRKYTVKEGEWLYEIMRRETNISSDRFHIIKKLNPQIKNLNQIRPGQIINLPQKDQKEQNVGQDVEAFSEVYTAKKGDSISRIAMRKLNVKKGEVWSIVNSIKDLNPNISNINKIHPGQSIKLPRKAIALTQHESKVYLDESPEKTKSLQTDKIILPPERSLEIIKHVINRMNGNFLINGKYFIPLPKIGQITIDCSIIPVVELDDGSTILLDLANRVPESLNKEIKESWKNYYIAKTSGNDDVFEILQQIVNSSTYYSMSKASKPFTIGKDMQIRLTTNWLISQKKKAEGKVYAQGIIIGSDDSLLIPLPISSYAEKNGVIITEIIDGRLAMKTPDFRHSVAEMPVIASTSIRDLPYSLLVLLGYDPVKQAEVTIFDTAIDGFKLSIIADLLVRKGSESLIVHSQRLPQQLIEQLTKKGISTLLIEDGDSKFFAIEKTLKSMGITHTRGEFTFPAIKDGDNLKYSILFPAIKITSEKENYFLIDFDLDTELYGFIKTLWGVNFIKF